MTTALSALSAVRQQVVTGAMTVQTDSVLAAARKVASIAAAADGVVTDEQTDTDPTGERELGDGLRAPDADAGTVSTLTVRIPPAAYDDTVANITALGRLVSQTRTTADVTDEYVDVQARVTSQQASLARLLDLVGTAGQLDDVIALENEIATRQSDLDALKARLAALDEEVGLATLVVTLTQDGNVVAAAKRTGFVGGLHRGWDAFTSAAGFVLTAIGALLPFAILLGLLALAAWPVVKRYRRRSAPSISASTPAPTQ